MRSRKPGRVATGKWASRVLTAYAGHILRLRWHVLSVCEDVITQRTTSIFEGKIMTTVGHSTRTLIHNCHGG